MADNGLKVSLCFTRHMLYVSRYLQSESNRPRNVINETLALSELTRRLAATFRPGTAIHQVTFEEHNPLGIPQYTFISPQPVRVVYVHDYIRECVARCRKPRKT